MAEALFTSYQGMETEAHSSDLSDVVTSAKRVSAKAGKRIKNYCTITQERVMEGVHSARNSYHNNGGCLGSLWGNSDCTESDNEEPLETTSLLPKRSARGRYRRVQSLGESDQGILNGKGEAKRKHRNLTKNVSTKLGVTMRLVGSWFVRGMHGYATAINPQGFAFNHDNTLYTQSYIP